MGESKYIEQLNKLIEDILSSKKESFPTLQTSTKQIIDEITIFINSNTSSPSETNMKEILSDYFMRQLRLKYQKEIINNISEETKIISNALLICEFIFWIINETKFISFKQSLKLLQDIVETIPFQGLEELFTLMSSSLKKLDNSFIEKGKLDILLIQNIFLKRTNNNLDSSLRGKILLLFCDLFSITEKSGTNIKGKYSSNQINEEISVYSNDNSDTVINDDDDIKEQKDLLKEKEENKMQIEEEKKEKNKEGEKSSESETDFCAEKNEKIKFYEQFWLIEKILINPFIVCYIFIIYILIIYFITL
jgi:hypothetical protein